MMTQTIKYNKASALKKRKKLQNETFISDKVIAVIPYSSTPGWLHHISKLYSGPIFIVYIHLVLGSEGLFKDGNFHRDIRELFFQATYYSVYNFFKYILISVGTPGDKIFVESLNLPGNPMIEDMSSHLDQQADLMQQGAGLFLYIFNF